MDIYADNILDHYKHPRRKHVLAAPTITHTEKNTSCGDALKLELMIEAGTITDLGWSGEGCAISQAGMSLLSEILIGKTLAEAAALTPKDVTDLLGVPVGTRRIKCALLCLHALKNAIHEFKEEPVQSWVETVGNDA